MKAKTLGMLGGSLTAVALVGYLTVADELHHLGEFFAVTGILLSGVALLIAGIYPGVARVLALPWVAACIGIGMFAGLVMDQEVVAVCIGAASGLFAAYLFRHRDPRSAAPAA